MADLFVRGCFILVVYSQLAKEIGGIMRGLLCAFIGATLWGFSGVCGDFLMSYYGASPLFVTVARALIAAILFLVAILWKYRETARALFANKEAVKQLLIFGAVGLFSCQVVYLWVIDLTNAGTATVMQSLNIVFIMIFTCLVTRSLPEKFEGLGAVTAFASIFVIATQGNPLILAMPLGTLLVGLFLGVCESFYIVYPKKLFAQFGSFVPTGLAMFVSGIVSLVFWLAAALMDGSLAAGAMIPELDMLGVLALLSVAVLGTFGAFALFLHGVSLIGPVEGSLMGAMEPVSAAVLSVVILGTAFSGWDWLGLILMVATFFLVTVKEWKNRA